MRVRQTTAKGLRPKEVTEREAGQRLLARLPDSELELVVGFLAWRNCLADIDEWGDIRALHGRGAASALRDLDEAERAEFGETLWEDWQRLEREGKIDPRAPEPEPPPSAEEEARRQRERAEGLMERMLPEDMPVVLAFLSWRARRSLRPRGVPAA
jgi:hypothetical protein